jgi:hypothetical protein
MRKPVIRLVLLVIALLLTPIGEGGNASAQPVATDDNAWNPPQRRRIVLMRHGDVAYFDAQGKPVANSDLVPLVLDLAVNL